MFGLGRAAIDDPEQGIIQHLRPAVRVSIWANADIKCRVTQQGAPIEDSYVTYYIFKALLNRGAQIERVGSHGSILLPSNALFFFVFIITFSLLSIEVDFLNAGHYGKLSHSTLCYIVCSNTKIIVS